MRVYFFTMALVAPCMGSGVCAVGNVEGAGESRTVIPT